MKALDFSSNAFFPAFIHNNMMLAGALQGQAVDW